jgi:hypothetical protein
MGLPWASSVYALVEPHFKAALPSPVVNKLWARTYTGTGLNAASSDNSFFPSFM